MNTNQWGSAPSIAICLAALIAMPGCAENRVEPRPEPAAMSKPATQAVTEPQEAKGILLRMADFLAKTPRFSVKIRSYYDVVQESGQKIEFGETRKIVVSRPNHLRVEAQHSDGEQQALLYDGKNITIFTPSLNVYAQAPKPGGIDAAVKYFLKDLHMRLPLAVLLLSSFPEEIANRTQSLAYIEKTQIQGKTAHHLAGRTETVDYQVWIATGAQPLLLRVVLTYKNAVGQPEFQAQLSDWNFAPEIQDSQFALNLPEGARKIAFVAQLPQIELPGAAKPQQTGGRK